MPKNEIIINKRTRREPLLLLCRCLVLWVIMGLLCGCYHRPNHVSEALVPLNPEQVDSLYFYSKHHYTNNHNFTVKNGSFMLLKQQPEELLSGFMTDSLVLSRHSHVAAADIRILSIDTVDSVWVQLASDQHTIRWIHESEMLPNVVPDGPISQFISTFSNTYLLVFLMVITPIAIAYWMRRLVKDKAWIVHFRDINSFYPTLLCLIVASSATLYASIQMFEPDMWRHFYYRPMLSPSTVPLLLMVLLPSTWTILIVGLVAVDDARHQLPFSGAVMYLSGLLATCAVNHIVFSLTALYYIGYPLFVVYYWFAIRQYKRHAQPHYLCGNCGEIIQHKGHCPRCGAMNSWRKM